MGGVCGHDIWERTTTYFIRVNRHCRKGVSVESRSRSGHVPCRIYRPAIRRSVAGNAQCSERGSRSRWHERLERPVPVCIRICGSQTLVSLGFSYFTNARAILPDIVEYYDHSLQMLTNVSLSVLRITRGSGERILRRFELVGTHLAKAAALAKTGDAKPEPDEPIGYLLFSERDRSRPEKSMPKKLNYAPSRSRTLLPATLHMLSRLPSATDIKTAGRCGRRKDEEGKTKRQ